MLKFKKKISITIQFEEEQLDWLEQKAYERSLKEKRKVSISELVREQTQKNIDDELEQ